ncbi:MAG: succinate--CoA ligase [Magnetovibrio sp.]|nr:succinate--CoA ligase [Magnetovibrio sp.]|tara:strand:+ start:1982 stop:3118 length:1137 start_codon:yes stop_codon:yes gene_type:complete
MNFEEYAAKPILAAAGISVPRSQLVTTSLEAGLAADKIGPCVVKAQVPTGKRGKAGGIKLAASATEARIHFENILGMEIGGHTVEKVLIEAQCHIAREFYAAILNDPETKGPIVMFSTEGGMDIEEIATETPEKLRKAPVDVRHGFARETADQLVDSLDLNGAHDAVAETLVNLYEAYATNDAELLEINPLVLTGEGDVMALDCKFVMDDSATKRQVDLALKGTPDKLTSLERVGEGHGIKYIELEGNVVVLANGAGLTMTTMDVVRHYGGKPANFCEIGGEAYTKGKAALEMVLAKPGVKSLVVNFCGAFARCDVMMDGLLEAWDEVQPNIPVFFSIAGTGDEEAIAMLKDKLGMDPLPNMDAACKAAADAANEGGI